MGAQRFLELQQALALPEEEIARMKERAKQPCPVCNGPMSVGEDENAGCCTACYFKAIENIEG